MGVNSKLKYSRYTTIKELLHYPEREVAEGVFTRRWIVKLSHISELVPLQTEKSPYQYQPHSDWEKTETISKATELIPRREATKLDLVPPEQTTSTWLGSSKKFGPLDCLIFSN
jgi:hypothetical protein